MKKILLASILAALGSSSAFAADMAAHMPTKAPMLAAPAPNWSGWYAGVNLGYGWGDGATDFVNIGALGAQNASLENNPKGVIGGAQIGYNWQSGLFVAGIEADIQGSAIRGSVKATQIAITGAIQPNDFKASQQSLSWFGTVRGRLGFAATPELLLYGTGGFAYGQVDYSANSTLDDQDEQMLAQLAKTKIGWTAGLGGEWAFARNWSAKMEYLYLDLGQDSATGSAPPAFTQFTWRTQDHIVRAGVNYRF